MSQIPGQTSPPALPSVLANVLHGARDNVPMSRVTIVTSINMAKEKKLIRKLQAGLLGVPVLQDLCTRSNNESTTSIKYVTGSCLQPSPWHILEPLKSGGLEQHILPRLMPEKRIPTFGCLEPPKHFLLV